jgi:mRNA-degrading endonuclease RelE of RelBE toxin-antitoxin system
MPYRYVVDQTADEAVATLPRRDQRILRDYFRFLAEHPFTPGDQAVADADGRLNQVKGHGRYVVTYRADHASRTVKIAALEFL